MITNTAETLARGMTALTEQLGIESARNPDLMCLVSDHLCEKPGAQQRCHPAMMLMAHHLRLRVQQENRLNDKIFNRYGKEFRKDAGDRMSQLTQKEEIIARLTPVFQKKGVRRAVLFGSYAEGTQTEKSDIDILVDSGMRGLRFYGLLEDVCQSVDRPVDLIDVYQIKPDSEFAREIAEKGILIYEQP